MKHLLFILFGFLFVLKAFPQQSVARRWNEVQLSAIRQDLARPPVQARNLYHVAMAMYDAWSVYQPASTPFLLGKTVNNVLYPFPGTAPVIGTDTLASQNMAISYAAYRVLKQRYALSPNAAAALFRFDTLMSNLGYNINITSTNYTSGTPAELGNYIAQQVLAMGLADGSNESLNYLNNYYYQANPYLTVANPGTSGMLDPNRWQPLNIVTSIDQNGNPVSSYQSAVCHEWGNVYPFSLDVAGAVTHFRDGNSYKVYIDPGGPSRLDTSVGNDASSTHYKWANEMVAVWSSLLDPNDNTMIDISPNGRGNLVTYPLTNAAQNSYYNYYQGGDYSTGHPLNPATGTAYVPQIVKRGDYARVISQFWADGPQSETPPGHWFVILNHVNDHPLFVKKFKGTGPVLSALEWDIKSYFTLGGAIHDAAIAAWCLKGWYDSPRPISAIRRMAEYGQSTNSGLPHYHKAGLPLLPGYIELVSPGDSLALVNPANLNKIKIRAWKGFDFISDPLNDVAGAGWILAENWMPYQAKTFVTPPFAGYVSGHSTYSRAGAEVMTAITGNAFFPGGIYETIINANSNFLKFEKGPSMQVKLQWATYTDASNEASISRIWGGIHPPTDDAPGRDIGKQIAASSVVKATQYFTNSVLPLDLISFTGFEKDCNVFLEWKTSRENQTGSFEVWSSANGLDYNRKIAVQNAKGNYYTASYFAADHIPLPNNFYQLVEIDRNGIKTILGSCHVKITGCSGMYSKLDIYPNPVSDNLNITVFSGFNHTALLTITNALGKTLYSENRTVQTGQNRYTINMKTFANGTYFISLHNANGVIKTEKFIKIK